MLTQALQATRIARAIVEQRAAGARRLIFWRAWRPVGQFRFGFDDTAVRDWVVAEGLGGAAVPAGTPHGDRA